MNFLFLVFPPLIIGYVNGIFGQLLGTEISYQIRVVYSVLPYFLFTFGQLNFVSVIIYLAALILGNLYLIIKEASFLTAAAWNCFAMILFNPLNEPHYFVFIFPIIFLWLAHPFGQLPKIEANTNQRLSQQAIRLIMPLLDGLFVMIFMCILTEHLNFTPFWRAIAYLIFCLVAVCSKLLSKNPSNQNLYNF